MFPTSSVLLNSVAPATAKVESKVTASSTFNVPFTVVVAPEDATLTAPLLVANEVAPLESNVETDVSPVTSNVPPAVVAEPPVASDVAPDDVNVVNAPVDADVAPIVVPSIAPPSILVEELIAFI